MAIRRASHAGSWYTSDGRQLSRQLDQWLDAVPSRTKGITELSSIDTAPELTIPSTGARAIIAP
jgi:MEMO1 family protein